MEIHAPDRPILSIKEVLVQLSIVTVGILIALSFDGAREWYEHRALVAEARRNLLSEIRDNQRTLEDNFLAKVDATRKDLANAKEVAQSLIDRQPRANLHWRLAYPSITLQSTSRATAEISGAYAFMGYEEVKRYAGVYALQAIFERLHLEGLRDADLTYAAGSASEDPTKVSAAELLEWKRLIAIADTSILILSQAGHELNEQYKKFLAEAGKSQ